jgi:hypothetical protein
LSIFQLLSLFGTRIIEQNPVRQKSPGGICTIRATLSTANPRGAGEMTQACMRCKVAAARRLAVRLYWMLRTKTGYPEIVRIESSPTLAMVDES